MVKQGCIYHTRVHMPSVCGLPGTVSFILAFTAPTSEILTCFNEKRQPQRESISSNGNWISRSIGDAYLKKAEFNREPLFPKFRVPEPYDKPILIAELTILVQELCSEDQFLIFASITYGST
ncbi:probable protein phosphatase 2C 28 isoform X2 [Mangifera indica]|nr:probable protein phosphatase 2C 28 isoform X2 [Mangifera indica]